MAEPEWGCRATLPLVNRYPPAAQATEVLPFRGYITAPGARSPRCYHTRPQHRSATIPARVRPFTCWCLSPTLADIATASEAPSHRLSRQPYVASGNHGNTPEAACCQSGRRISSALAIPSSLSPLMCPYSPRGREWYVPVTVGRKLWGTEHPGPGIILRNHTLS